MPPPTAPMAPPTAPAREEFVREEEQPTFFTAPAANQEAESEAELEVAVLEETRQRELALDRRLATLERLAESFEIQEEPEEDVEDRKEFCHRFVRDPLSGYYIEKSRVTQREAQLKHIAVLQHPSLYWLSGSSGPGEELAEWSTQSMQWRQLYK